MANNQEETSHKSGKVCREEALVRKENGEHQSQEDRKEDEGKKEEVNDGLL